MDGNRLVVATHVDISIEALVFTIFRFAHRSEEIWESGQLVSINSTTDDDGTALQVSGSVVDGGFRIVGANRPFQAARTLMTSDTLWDSRILRETKLLDAQRGGEMGLITRQLADELVDTPRGTVRASCHLVVTPLYAGQMFYDAEGRRVKALLELQGETSNMLSRPSSRASRSPHPSLLEFRTSGVASSIARWAFRG
jgi:hypothetical protein